MTTTTISPRPAGPPGAGCRPSACSLPAAPPPSASSPSPPTTSRPAGPIVVDHPTPIPATSSTPSTSTTALPRPHAMAGSAGQPCYE